MACVCATSALAGAGALACVGTALGTTLTVAAVGWAWSGIGGNVGRLNVVLAGVTAGADADSVGLASSLDALARSLDGAAFSAGTDATVACLSATATVALLSVSCFRAACSVVARGAGDAGCFSSSVEEAVAGLVVADVFALSSRSSSSSASACVVSSVSVSGAPSS